MRKTVRKKMSAVLSILLFIHTDIVIYAENNNGSYTQETEEIIPEQDTETDLSHVEGELSSYPEDFSAEQEKNSSEASNLTDNYETGENVSSGTTPVVSESDETVSAEGIFSGIRNDDSYKYEETDEGTTEESVYSNDSESEEYSSEEDAADLILQEGGFISAEASVEEYETEGLLSAGQYLAAASEEFDINRDFEAISAVFVAAAESRTESVDIRDFHVPRAYSKILYSKILNKNPQLFYILPTYKYYYSGDYITRYAVQYNEAYDDTHIAAFYERAEEILSDVDPSWSEEQKTLFVHDRIVTGTEYDLTYSKYNAYNALVEGTAVCHGYSLAYEYLMDRLGIRTDVISSSRMNHAWNSVVVDDVPYYVDCTWDDPAGYYLMYCKHSNFLRSQEGIRSTGHYSDDWADTNSNTVIDVLALNEYPDPYWLSSFSWIPHVGDLWAYVSDKEIFVHDYSNGSNRLLTSDLDGNWDLQDNTGFLSGRYVHLDSYQDYFLASQQDSAYYIDLGGNCRLLGIISNEEKEQGRVYGIQREGEMLRYDIYRSPTGSDRQSFGYFNLNDIPDVQLYFDAKEINLNYGETFDLNTILHTNSDEMEWSVTDVTAVTVEKGIITAAGKGNAVITVSAGGISASITVNIIVPLEKIDLNKTDLVLDKGDMESLSVLFYPEDTTEDRTVVWTSSDQSVVSVDDNGKIIAVGSGDAYVTAAAGEKTASAAVRVRVSAEELRLDTDAIAILPGDAKQLTASVLPESADDKEVMWTSGNEFTASVDESGLVKGFKPGVTTVSAETGNGITAECRVTVQFTDVTDPTDDFYDLIYEMAEKNITAGYSDGSFRPFNDCNRAAAVTFLWRLAGKPEPHSQAEFSDMTGNTDFDNAISWAAENGITTGWDDNTFRPWQACNRAAMITFLWRTAGKPEPHSQAEFSDMTGNADFDNAISWAAENEIIAGWYDNTFRPWQSSSRNAVISFIAAYDEISHQE